MEIEFVTPETVKFILVFVVHTCAVRTAFISWVTCAYKVTECILTPLRTVVHNDVITLIDICNSQLSDRVTCIAIHSTDITFNDNLSSAHRLSECAVRIYLY